MRTGNREAVARDGRHCSVWIVVVLQGSGVGSGANNSTSVRLCGKLLNGEFKMAQRDIL